MQIKAEEISSIIKEKIKGFDKYSVILEANNQEQLIFKHAISTVTTAKQQMAPPPPAPTPVAAT